MARYNPQTHWAIRQELEQGRPWAEIMPTALLGVKRLSGAETAALVWRMLDVVVQSLIRDQDRLKVPGIVIVDVERGQLASIDSIVDSLAGDIREGCSHSGAVAQ